MDKEKRKNGKENHSQNWLCSHGRAHRDAAQENDVGKHAGHQFAAQMREFIAAISERRQPLVTHHQMLTQMAIIEAAKQSAASNQPVTPKL
jgi:predicted dehydrogenase